MKKTYRTSSPSGFRVPKRTALQRTQRNSYPEKAEWDALKRSVKARDGNKCVKCGITSEQVKSVPGLYLEVDHIIRLADGGTNRMTNLQTLCSVCHRNRLNHGHLR